jgi:hypothetical protein
MGGLFRYGTRAVTGARDKEAAAMNRSQGKGWSGFSLFNKKCTTAFNRTVLLALIEAMEVEKENGSS